MVSELWTQEMVSVCQVLTVIKCPFRQHCYRYSHLTNGLCYVMAIPPSSTPPFLITLVIDSSLSHTRQGDTSSYLPNDYHDCSDFGFAYEKYPSFSQTGLIKSQVLISSVVYFLAPQLLFSQDGCTIDHLTRQGRLS